MARRGHGGCVGGFLALPPMKPTSRLTYANVASTLALVLALGGGGAAVAAGLAKNSVGTKQLKAQAVTSAKVKDNALTGQDIKESTLGQVPSAATADSANTADTAVTATTAARAGNVHSALVRANGALVAEQSLDAVSAEKQGTGLYAVTFDRDITDCTPLASIAYPGVGFLTVPGSVHVTGLSGKPAGLFVVTTSLEGGAADFPFSVMVVC